MTDTQINYVELHELIKAYPNPLGDPVRVVDRFSTRIAKGEFASIIGHSGCGKSTVLTMVAGLNPITRGSVILDGHEVDAPGPDRAVVFQSPCLLPWMTAFENVMLGVRQSYPAATPVERRQIVEHYLALVGLGDAMHKHPGELSGGMQQRVGVARAIALNPKLLLLDEPFGMLDSLTRMILQEKVLELVEAERITTMMITHDVDEALFMSDRIIMMTSGPAARVGQVLQVPFDRPRDRSAVLADDLYYDFRGCLIEFLEGEDTRGGKPSEATSPGDPGHAADPTEPAAAARETPELELVTA